MKYSIVIPLWNRKSLLHKSLLKLSALRPDVEVSIYENPGDEQPIDDVWMKQFGLPYIYTRGEERPIPRCPVREINEAAKVTTGDMVCVQAAEIYHLQDTFAELDAIIEPGANRFYISPTVNLDQEATDEFFSGKPLELNKVHLCNERSKSYINPVAKVRWGIHPVYNPTPIAQFIAMERWLWNKIGGFDESYGDGNSWGDQSLLMQLWEAGSTLTWLNSVVIHPFHGENYTTDHQVRAGNKNKRIFERKWGISGDEIDKFYRTFSKIHPRMMNSDALL